MHHHHHTIDYDASIHLKSISLTLFPEAASLYNNDCSQEIHGAVMWWQNRYSQNVTRFWDASRRYFYTRSWKSIYAFVCRLFLLYTFMSNVVQIGWEQIYSKFTRKRFKNIQFIKNIRGKSSPAVGFDWLMQLIEHGMGFTIKLWLVVRYLHDFVEWII